MKISYRLLPEDSIKSSLFANFHRYQEVTYCYRKVEDGWVLKEIPFIEDWDSWELEKLTRSLLKTVREGGVFFGAFDGENLIGFFSIKSEAFGSQREYLQLSNLHVSYEYRNHGIGKELFRLACQKAADMGAKKLYLSTHSSYETQAFYRAVGCVEALFYNPKLVAREPYDCQLEYSLEGSIAESSNGNKQ